MIPNMGQETKGMRLENKTVVITGGASGIGRTLVRGMAKEGARVVIADVNRKKAQEAAREIAAGGGEALALETDVSEKQQVEAMIQDTVKAFKTLDVLICCAAIKRTASLEELSIQDWDRIMAVNVRGVFLCVQAAAALMAEQKLPGSIIVMNSLAAYRGRRNQQAYCASKAALLAFVGNAALQLGKYGIRVNGLAPGILDVEDPEPLEDKGYKTEHIPMGRPGRPEELIGPAVFLATEDSSYISGETIKVDGAFSQRLSGCDI